MLPVTLAAETRDMSAEAVAVSHGPSVGAATTVAKRGDAACNAPTTEAIMEGTRSSGASSMKIDLGSDVRVSGYV
jgi:hypothetical protein